MDVASKSVKRPAVKKKGKTITLSLSDQNNNENDSVICLDDLPQMPSKILPKVNPSLIDLTNLDSSSESSQESQGKNKIAKSSLTLDLGIMGLGSAGGTSTKMQLRSRNKVMGPQEILHQPGPSTSRAPISRKSMNEPCYEKLQKMMSQALITNYEDFVCCLCNKLFLIGAGVTLKECLHSFCRQCLIAKINRVKPGTIRVDCPNSPEICDSFITMEEIQALLGDNFESFVQKIDESSTESLLPILLAMDDMPFIPNVKAFTCQVCYSDIAEGEGVLLKNCLHNGCKDCLAQLIHHAEEFQVQCPFVENDHGCKEYIQEGEMRYLVTEEVFDRHLKKSLKIAEHANELNFHCRGLDCENFVELTEGITKFSCSMCGAVNCIPCKAVHPGKTCLDYQEEINPELKNSRLQNENKQSEEAIEKDIAEGKAMRCPRCSIPVMKITGCDFITCSACKLGICWVTRKPRLDFTRGNGQVVEGCKCKAPPTMKRCHPKCGNCH